MDQLPAAVYCRISSDPTGERAGVTRQEEDCLALAERHGWEVAGVWVDNDMSAYTGKPRPAWSELLDEIRAGRVGRLVGWHPDRFTRHVRELEDLIDLVESAGVQVATVTAGAYDLSTPSGRLIARQLGAHARYESEHKSERIRRARDDRAAKGLPHPGPRAFGFLDGNLEHHPGEVELICDAARRITAGESLRSLTNDWNERGVRTARGNRWSVSALRDVLLSPRMVALREHRGEILGEAAWDPILDRETWEHLRSEAKRRARPGRPPNRLLSGVLLCGLCGAGMVSWMDHGNRHYRCQRQPSRAQADPCGRISLVAAPVEEFIRDAVLHRLASPQLAGALASEQDRDENAQVLADIEAAERKLESLADDYADGSVSRATFLRTSQRLEAKIAAGRARLAASTRSATLRDLPTDEEGLRRWWNRRSTSDSSRRAVVRAVLASVRVMPAEPHGPRKFQPERLADPVWRV